MSGYPDFTKWWDKEMLLNDVFMPQYEPSTFVYTKQDLDKKDEITPEVKILIKDRARELKSDLQENLIPLKYELQPLQKIEEFTNKNCLKSINVERKEAEKFHIFEEEINIHPPNQLKYLKPPATRFTEPTLPPKITNLSKQPKFEPPKAARPDIRTDNHRKLALLETKNQLIEINNNRVAETRNLQPRKQEIKPKFYRMVAHDPTKTSRMRKQHHSQLVKDHILPVSRYNKTYCPEFNRLDKFHHVGAGDVFGMQYPCPNYFCKRCQRSFISRKFFYKPSKHRMKKFECFCCFKMYVYGSGLAQHIKMEHSELLRKPFRCNVRYARP